MPTETQQRVYDLLHRMPQDGLSAAKQLFWTELNYDRANRPLSHRNWPERAQDTLAEPPTLLARHESQFGPFDIVYARLAQEQRGRDFPLSLTAERLVVNQLLPNHPYSLFIFSDPSEQHWHLVNVRYDKDMTRRRVFRRISVGPFERLRTASERVSRLDLATLSPDLFGLSPIAIQQRHDEAFDVEAVTREFFRRFASLFYQVRSEIAAIPDLAVDADAQAQTLLDRLVFLYFIQKKGWLHQDPDYLYKRFLQGHASRPGSTSYYGEVIYPLFVALSERDANRDLTETLGNVPFLNGGLFDLPLISGGLAAGQARLSVSNATFKAIFEELLEHYNFTISEDSPLDQEVAIDPEMLGKIFENLVLQREQDPHVDLRKATGSYYTPRTVVAYMCREALAEYLAGQSGIPREHTAALLDLPPADRLTDEEQTRLRNLVSTTEAQLLKSSLLHVRACDPAVGSGAFLLGLLQTITWAVGLLDWRLHGDAILAQHNYTYDLKKQVIEQCLYGVDIQAQAVQICELRLWLSLVVDYQLPEGMPFDVAVREVPALPNLAFRVRQGDSLLERLFGHVVQLDELAKDQETREIVENLQKEKAAYFTIAETSEKRRRELRILELQVALAGKLTEAKRKRISGYQPPLLGEETTKARKDREAWEARLQQYKELATRMEAVRKRLTKLRRDDDSGGLTADELRSQLLGDSKHPTFLWRVDFAEVFQDKDGFDIMIANPPYVRQERISYLKADLVRVYPDIYHGVADIYVYFYALGLRQLHDEGVLVFISSNKFMRAGYGKTLRRLLGQEVTMRTLIDFGDLPIFEATTYPMVLTIQKRRPAQGHIFQALTVDDMAMVHHLPEAVREHAWEQPQSDLRPGGWSLVHFEVQALLEKLRRSGTQLGRHMSGRFYRGVTTGLNEAFVVDQSTRDLLIARDPRSAEIIRPWIRGRDIDRWQVDWDRYLLWTYQGVDIKVYPAVLEYLSKYRNSLAKRWEPSHGQCEWYELRPCDYYTEFEKPKIVYPDIAKNPEFAYDITGAYGGNTMYILPTDELYLLGILNSAVMEFFYAQISSSIQSDYLRFIATYMEQVPIPKPTSSQVTTIESLVRKLLDARGQGPWVAEWEQKLNVIVYETYGLTKAEIDTIWEFLELKAKKSTIKTATKALDNLRRGS